MPTRLLSPTLLLFLATACQSDAGPSVDASAATADAASGAIDAASGLDLTGVWTGSASVLGGADGPPGTRNFCFDLVQSGTTLTGSACGDEVPSSPGLACDPAGVRGGEILVPQQKAAWTFQLPTQQGPVFIYDVSLDLPVGSGSMSGVFVENDDCAGTVCSVTLSRGTGACP